MESSRHASTRSAFATTVRQILKGFCLAVVACATVLAILLAWAVKSGAPPTQTELRARFVRHRGDYEQLRSMILEDRLVTVGDEGRSFARSAYRWTSAHAAGISTDRQRRYATLMARTDTPRVDRGEDGSVMILMASDGWAGGGWRISVVSRADTPAPLLRTIDGFRKPRGRSAHGYSRAAGGWYLRILRG